MYVYNLLCKILVLLKKILFINIIFSHNKNNDNKDNNNNNDSNNKKFFKLGKKK